MDTTVLTSYPRSLRTLTALSEDPPVVVTSSNTVILLPLGGNGPSTCDAVP